MTNIQSFYQMSFVNTAWLKQAAAITTNVPVGIIWLSAIHSKMTQENKMLFVTMFSENKVAIAEAVFFDNSGLQQFSNDSRTIWNQFRHRKSCITKAMVTAMKYFNAGPESASLTAQLHRALGRSLTAQLHNRESDSTIASLTVQLHRALGRSRRQSNFVFLKSEPRTSDDGTGAWNLVSGSTSIVCGAMELYK